MFERNDLDLKIWTCCRACAWMIFFISDARVRSDIPRILYLALEVLALALISEVGPGVKVHRYSLYLTLELSPESL